GSLRDTSQRRMALAPGEEKRLLLERRARQERDPVPPRDGRPRAARRSLGGEQANEGALGGDAYRARRGKRRQIPVAAGADIYLELPPGQVTRGPTPGPERPFAILPEGERCRPEGACHGTVRFL